MLAYLVIREGSKWTDVFRLTPGRRVTIGRAATNQIVVKDDRASRNHAEVFSTAGQWTLRDLESRNGTIVGELPIKGDYPLSPGEIVRIGHYQMAFVHDLTQAFSGADNQVDLNETVCGELPSRSYDTQEMEFEPSTITHRRGRTKFYTQEKAETESSLAGKAATKLCRLAFELAQQSEPNSVCTVGLDGLIDETLAEAGAILMLRGSELELLVSRSDLEFGYFRVSQTLANMVVDEGEAVLARNIDGDSTLGIHDSQGVFQASSVICAPIRLEGEVLGLVHLYCSAECGNLDAEDLEFTLAVADNVALALGNLGREQELNEGLRRSRREIQQLREQLGVESEIVGSGALMLQLQTEIGRAAPSKATVLIRGESGVGKELVARAVHYSSPRKKGPFVCLNCAALSETLLESELFGHERGAFTGATDRKTGKFESADQGTLMLDEIGEMSLAIQTKFLRVLEGHSFERVGGSKAIKVDVRVIAATNRDLEKAVADGTFRRDLYFRLRVVEIYVPPLRKRPSDVPELAEFFLARFNSETGRKLKGFTDDAMEVMQKYRWPGNVRELKNVIERAVLLVQGDSIGREDLALSNLATASESGEIALTEQAYHPRTLADVERDHISDTLLSTEWNKSRAAEILGIERSTLDRKIRRYELKRP